MKYFDLVVDQGYRILDGFTNWNRAAYQCSADSHAFVYVLLISWLVLSVAGVFIYQRVNAPKTTSLSLAQAA